MKEVKWVGEERMIPSYGMGRKDEIKILPADMANSFIKQGLAEEVDNQPSIKVKKQIRKESE